MKVIVTGGAGFVGSNIVAGLNARGIDDVIVVDDLTQSAKFRNIVDAQISDYVDYTDFYQLYAAGKFGKVAAVFHEGACSDTMEHDGRYMMANNYRCSVNLLDACLHQGTRLLYASSAATYGMGSVFHEVPENEHPLNIYGYSKLLFDNVVRRRASDLDTQVAGFRYFNVYGPREAHKGRMASVAFHHFSQLRTKGSVALFGEYDGYGAGRQMRDFVHVDDVVAVNLWFFDNPAARGIFNVGTGRAQPFNDVAHAAVNAWRGLSQHTELSLVEQVDQGLVTYSDFPDALKGKYQSYTKADISALRTVGYHAPFTGVSEGVHSYVRWLAAQPPG